MKKIKYLLLLVLVGFFTNSNGNLEDDYIKKIKEKPRNLDGCLMFTQKWCDNLEMCIKKDENCLDKKFEYFLEEKLKKKIDTYMKKFFEKIEKLSSDSLYDNERIILIEKINYRINNFLSVDENKKYKGIFLYLKQKLDLKKRDYFVEVYRKKGGRIFLEVKKDGYYINGDDETMNEFCREKGYKHNVYHGKDNIKYKNNEILVLKYNKKNKKFELVYSKIIAGKLLCTKFNYA